MSRFDAIGVIRNKPNFDENKLNTFEERINNLLNMRKWNKEEIVELFFELLPEFAHKETKYLDQKNVVMERFFDLVFRV